MRNIFNLSFKFQFRKKTTILNIILISLSFLIVLGINTYSDSAMNYMENDVYKSIYFKSLEVSVREDEDRNKVRKDLENLENVSLVSNFYSYSDILTSKELSNKKLSGEVQIHVSNNNSLPQIIKGTKFPDNKENYLICPKKLYSTSNTDSLKTISSNYAIDMNKFLNKKVTFSYKSNMGRYNYDISFKVIGLYENNSYLDANVCFTQENSLEEIAKNKYADDYDKENGISNLDYQRSLFVQVDNLDNMEKVTNQISSLGYYSDLNAMVIKSYFTDIKDNAQTISTIVIIITAILLLLIAFKQYSEDAKTYKLLSYLGYRRTQINKVAIVSNIMQIVISLFISMIIFGIFYLIFKLLLNYYPYLLNNWKVCINYKSIISVLIIVLLSSLVSIVVNVFRLNKGEYK